MNQILYFSTDDLSSKTIMLWSWEDVPPELKGLLPQDGDEDWVALVPHDYFDPYCSFAIMMERCSGSSHIQTIKTPWGIVHISSHA